MQILYGFSNCTDKKYNELTEAENISVLRPDQKYHGLLIKGLHLNGAKVKCFSGLPVNRHVTKRLFIYHKGEVEDGVSYRYYTTINIPVLRQICIFVSAFFSVIFTKKDENSFIICDCLTVSNSYGMALAGRLRKIPVITIVTDIPDFVFKSITVKKIANGLFKFADGFIILTKEMNTRINPDLKPSIVLEGHVDSCSPEADILNKKEIKDGIKQIVYSGGVRSIYGIDNLTEGFILANLDNAELVIYGDGDYVNTLKEIAEKKENIKYMGVCGNSQIIEAQQASSLLINPRPTAQEYTKYSFPSKNMEYMASGTPLLTTHLPGMPDEYLPYVFLIEDETPLGISDALREFFNLSFKERSDFGKKAREFVIKNKSNVKQAEKILTFLKNNF